MVIYKELGYLNDNITEKMVAAVGFKNLIVHEYGKIDLELVFEAVRKDIDDLNEYLRSIFDKFNIS